MSGYERRNRKVFRSCWKVCSVDALATCSRCGLRLPEKRESQWRSVGSRNDQVVGSGGPESCDGKARQQHGRIAADIVVRRRSEHGITTVTSFDFQFQLYKHHSGSPIGSSLVQSRRSVEAPLSGFNAAENRRNATHARDPVSINAAVSATIQLRVDCDSAVDLPRSWA